MKNHQKLHFSVIVLCLRWEIKNYKPLCRSETFYFLAVSRLRREWNWNWQADDAAVYTAMLFIVYVRGGWITADNILALPFSTMVATFGTSPDDIGKQLSKFYKGDLLT